MKDSCCCGATKANPCACMKKDIMECSSKEPKCPCYKALELKKSFDGAWNLMKKDTVAFAPTDSEREDDGDDFYAKRKDENRKRGFSKD